MVLEEAIILVGDTADAAEDSAFHSILVIRSETVDGIWFSVSFSGGDASVKGGTMIVPNIYLRNLAVGACKGLF